MRVVNLSPETSVNSSTDAYQDALENTPLTHKSYHELSENPVVEMDALNQLHSNLEMLSDLNNRLSFMMREVRYLMKV